MANELTPVAESVHLYLTDATSDKEYTMSLEEKGDGWVFNYAFGARGSKLKAGTKTPTPVDYATAKKEYDKQLKGQLKKRYTTNKDGQTLADNPDAERYTDLLPQLLNPVSQDDAASVEDMLAGSDWVMQEKHNGERRMIHVSGTGNMTGANKQGLAIKLGEGQQAAMRDLGERIVGGCVIDGEDMGDHLVIFDLLELNGVNLRKQPYEARLAALEELLDKTTDTSVLRLIKTSRTSSEKRAMMAEVRGRHGEGVVFKQKKAGYEPNRPASLGPQIKVKFLETATVRVAAISATKRSVEVEVRLPDGTARAMGKVSIPASDAIPKVGDLIEVEYLYVVKDGSFTQPTYEKPRRDQTWEFNCGVEQLKEVASRAKPKPAAKRKNGP